MNYGELKRILTAGLTQISGSQLNNPVPAGELLALIASLTGEGEGKSLSDAKESIGTMTYKELTAILGAAEELVSVCNATDPVSPEILLALITSLTGGGVNAFFVQSFLCSAMC